MLCPRYTWWISPLSDCLVVLQPNFKVPFGKRLHNYGKSPFYMGKFNYFYGNSQVFTCRIPRRNHQMIPSLTTVTAWAPAPPAQPLPKSCAFLAMLSILRKRRPRLEGDQFIGSLRVRMPLEDRTGVRRGGGMEGVEVEKGVFDGHEDVWSECRLVTCR